MKSFKRAVVNVLSCAIFFLGMVFAACAFLGATQQIWGEAGRMPEAYRGTVYEALAAAAVGFIVVFAFLLGMAGAVFGFVLPLHYLTGTYPAWLFDARGRSRVLRFWNDYERCLRTVVGAYELEMERRAADPALARRKKIFGVGCWLGFFLPMLLVFIAGPWLKTPNALRLVFPYFGLLLRHAPRRLLGTADGVAVAGIVLGLGPFLLYGMIFDFARYLRHPWLGLFLAMVLHGASVYCAICYW